MRKEKPKNLLILIENLFGFIFLCFKRNTKKFEQLIVPEIFFLLFGGKYPF